MLQVPFALLQLGLRPARRDRGQHAAVGVADDPLRLTGQRAEEGAPVGGLGTCERLSQPEPRPAGGEADARRRRRRRPCRPGSACPSASRARTLKGRWSSRSEPSAGQAAGRWGSKTTGAKTSTQSATSWP